MYEATYEKLSNFHEDIRFGDMILYKKSHFKGYTREEDYKEICNIIKNTMLDHGVELIIVNSPVNTLKDGVRARYVRMACAYAIPGGVVDEVSEENAMHEIDSNSAASEDSGSRNTNTKRIANCPAVITLNWRSDTAQWKVGKCL